MDWQEAKDIKKDLEKVVKTLNLSHVNASRIFCYRTTGSKARAYARIWSMPKIFQNALSIEPAYVVEAISKKYDKLSPEKKIQVIIHELLHIPKNFSGALLPHRGRGRNLGKMVKVLYKEYKEKNS